MDNRTGSGCVGLYFGCLAMLALLVLVILVWVVFF